MSILIFNRRNSIDKLRVKFPESTIIDVTSKSTDEFVKLSPFYPHLKIPVPFSPGIFSKSVEGIWQGLKVFDGNDIDISKFEIETMKGLKRTQRKYGKTLGHRNGVSGTLLLDYLKARQEIYIPTYNWILDNKVQPLMEKLQKLIQDSRPIILLDYDVNDDINNMTKPLSHASIIRHYLEKG